MRALQVPNFELDLFGRVRSLTHVQLERYLATEAGARATRLDPGRRHRRRLARLCRGLEPAADRRANRCQRAKERPPDPHPARRRGRAAHRPQPGRANPRARPRPTSRSQRTAVAQDVNALQLLVGAPIDPKLLAGSIDEAFGKIAPVPAGLDSYVLLRRPDVVQAEYQLRAANAQIGAARAALFPRITLTGLLGFASSALDQPVHRRRLRLERRGDAAYTIFQSGAGHANVRLSEAQRNAAVATYQKTVQTAFREVADALARRGTINDEIGARERQQAATADTYMLTEARYRAGIDPFLTVLDAQRSYYSAQQQMVQTKLTAAQNIVDAVSVDRRRHVAAGDAGMPAAPGDVRLLAGLISRSQQREQREARQPMLAHIVAGDMRQRRRRDASSAAASAIARSVERQQRRDARASTRRG